MESARPRGLYILLMATGQHGGGPADKGTSDALEFISKFREHTRDTATYSEKIQDSWEGVHRQIKGSVDSIIPGLRSSAGFAREVFTAARYFSAETAKVVELKKKLASTPGDWHMNFDLAEAATKARHLRSELFKLISVTTSVATVELFIRGYRNLSEASKPLGIMSSDLTERQRVLTESIRSARASASSLGDATQMYSSLSRWGRDFSGDMEESSKYGLLMSSSLGLSTDHASRLLAVGHRMGSTYENMANTMTRIRETTRLTADEMGQCSVEIQKSLMLLNKVGDVSKFIEENLGLEDAMRRVSGISGEFNQWISKMTSSTQGAMTSYMIGMSPEEVMAPGGQEKLMDSWGALVDRMTDGQPVLSQLAVLESLSEQTGASTLMLKKLSEAHREYARMGKSEKDILTRWKEETSNLGHASDALKNSLQLLIDRGMLPLVTLVKKAETWLTKFVTGLNEALGDTGSLVLTVITGLGAVVTLLKLAKDFFGMYFAANRWAAGVNGAARVASAAAPLVSQVAAAETAAAVGSTSMLRFIPAILRTAGTAIVGFLGLPVVIAAIVAAAVAAATYVWYSWTRNKKDAEIIELKRNAFDKVVKTQEEDAAKLRINGRDIEMLLGGSFLKKAHQEAENIPGIDDIGIKKLDLYAIQLQQDFLTHLRDQMVGRLEIEDRSMTEAEKNTIAAIRELNVKMEKSAFATQELLATAQRSAEEAKERAVEEAKREAMGSLSQRARTTVTQSNIDQLLRASGI